MLGNKIFDIVVAAINLIGILSCMSIFIYTEFIFKRTLPDNQKELMKMSKAVEEEIIPNLYPLKKSIINLISSNAKLRFLDIEMHIQLFKSSQQELMKSKEPIIYNAMINIIGGMTPDEINTLAGKILLEERIKKEVNQSVGTALIKKIYFTTFVVQ